MGRPIKLPNPEPGDTFGEWTVLAEGPRTAASQRRWVCKCSCGSVKLRVKGDILYPNRDRCSSHHKSTDPKPGDVFGEWEVLSSGPRAGHNPQWLCRCSCGTERLMQKHTLLSGASTSCLNHTLNTDSATYEYVHNRIRRLQGPASWRNCVDCGSPANDWSYSHNGGSNERISADSRSLGAPFSLDISDYDPRCKSCHKTFDLAYIALLKGDTEDASLQRGTSPN